MVSGRLRLSRFLIVPLTLALLALAVGAPVIAAKNGGNSANAKQCQKGGWMELQGSDGTTFGNQRACVTYAAKGGVLQSAAAAVFARAFSNIDGLDGFDSADVLVAELVDTNGSGVLDAGDTVRTVQYPIDNTATTFLPYGVTSHTVTAVVTATAAMVEVNTANSLFVWVWEGRELFAESLLADEEVFSLVEDRWGGGGVIGTCDFVLMNTSSASQPAAPLRFVECGTTEGDWFDVVISLGT